MQSVSTWHNQYIKRHINQLIILMKKSIITLLMELNQIIHGVDFLISVVHQKKHLKKQKKNGEDHKRRKESSLESP